MALVSPALLRLTKQIVRGAAEFGLDDAGSRVCGASWPLVKKLLSPVVAELDRRFPALMLADTDAAKAAADKAADALDADPALQAMLADGFAKLEQGQAEILALLAKNDAQLSTIGATVDRTEGKMDEMMRAFREFAARAAVQPAPAEAAPDDDPQAVFDALNEANYTAISRANAGDAAGALATLTKAKALGEACLGRAPENVDVAVALGFIEKTLGSVEAETNPDQAVAAYSRAAALFTRGLQSPSEDIAVSAMNGMANVYQLTGDYDRAIGLGKTIATSAPTYGPAIFDYALALEGKWRRDGADRALLETLAAVYRQLQPLMAQSSQRFSAEHLTYVMGRAAAVEQALAGNPAPAAQP
jgi:tetratricopeptide (TPR) repeat protein